MNSEAITNNRLSYMDIAKGFGILCVIAGHMGNETINRFVFSFHMPLFFLISGYFLSQKNTPKELFYKRSKQLLPPYIFTCFCIFLLSLFKNTIGILFRMKSINDLFLDAGKWIYASLYGAGTNHDIPFRVIQIGAIWFLLAMIIGSYIVKIIETKKNPVLWLMIVCCLGYFSSKLIWLPWSIQSAMTASVFIYIGVLIKRYHIIEKHSNIVFPAALVLWINEIIKGNPCIGIVTNQYPNGAFDFIGGGVWSNMCNSNF